MNSLLIYFGGITLTILLVICAQRMPGFNNTAYISIENGNMAIKKSLFFVILAFIPLWTIIAFRDMSVGRDTYGTQYMIYRYLSNNSYYDFAHYGSESGYFLLNKICLMLSDSYQLVIIVTATISWGLFYSYIINNSVSPWLSILLFFLNFGYFHQFNIMRQYIACGIILFGFKYIRRREMLKYFIVVFIAFFFHKISLLAILYYFIYDIRISAKKGLCIVIFSKIGFKFFMAIVTRVVADTRYYFILNNLKSYKSGYMILELLIAAIIYGFAMIIEYYYNTYDDKDFNFNVILSMLAMIICANSNMIPIPYRILWYVNMNNIVFIPRLISCIDNDKKRQLSVLFWIALFVIYFFYEWNNGMDGVQNFIFWKRY